MNRKEYLKKWREDNKEHIRYYKKEYAKTHDSSFKKLQDKYKQLQQDNKQLKDKINYLERNNNRREDTILEQRQRISDLEDNWNKLEKWVNKHYEYYMTEKDYIGGRLCFTDMKNKMQEIIGG